ncbi:MAG TPA: aminotransferase class I/II-fold pyridoxal phosphate-dependent enzyme [bacterium]|nr:aminotransferase class I/II-fold pyridoxal phosphate-dependent enzyme [bacterium]
MDEVGARARLEVSPEEMRRLGYHVVDLLVRHWETVGGKPVWRTADRAEMEARFREPPPEHGTDPGALLERMEGEVFGPIGHLIHPRFLGFIPSPSNWISVLADLLVAGHNPFAGNWLEAAPPAMIETVVLDWLREACGLPQGAGGVLVSGGSMANLTGLACARHNRLAADTAGAVIYASDQTHSSVFRGLRVLGFAEHQVRTLPTAADGRLPVGALHDAVAADRSAGRRPFCVVANAGTTNTGAVDPLPALADLCAEAHLWLHIDGAHGAAAVLCEQGRAVLAGLERADSLVLDPHKWLFQPYEIGCLLVREARWLPEAFRVTPEYLKITEGVPEAVSYMDHGVQLTRSFRALKLWLSLKVFGFGAFREAIAHGITLAEQTESWLRAAPEWEVASPAQLAILCFRYRAPGLDDAGTDALNDAMAQALNAEGFAFLSPTALGGRTVLRICPINPRTTPDDLRETLRRLAEHGRRLAPSFAR